MSDLLCDTLLLTGAAGGLGRVLAEPLRARCRRLVVSDLPQPLATLQTPAEKVACDLADWPSVKALVAGADAIVHLGGVSVETPFEPILQANIRGLFHLYEAARLAGTKRVVFASSNHVTGCYAQDERIGPQDPPRPDGYYGLSKLFGEGMARMYWDRYGIQTVCLRIGTATVEPPNARGLSTWLSHRDLLDLVCAGLSAPDVGFLIAYGMSDNARGWWDTRDAWARLGFTPQDSADPWTERLQDTGPPPGSKAARLQGGVFLDVGPFPEPR
jgi:uronate dehydrogenase